MIDLLTGSPLATALIGAGILALVLLISAVVRTRFFASSVGVKRAVEAAAAPKSPPARAAPMPGDLTRDYSPKDREFLPAALEIVETPASPVGIAGIWLIGAAFIAALAWSYFGKLDIHAVAQGRIQPSGRSKPIQPVEPGRVVAIMVENGSRVAAGDVLIELDPTDSGADREAQTRDLEAARAESERRQVAIAIATDPARALLPRPILFSDSIAATLRRRETDVLAGEVGQLRSARASQLALLAEKSAMRARLAASIKSREKVIALAKERVDMRTTLNESGSLSRALVIEVLSQYETQVTTQISEQGQLTETEAAIRTVESKIDEIISQFVADQSQKMAEAQRKADRIAQELVKATAKNEHTTIRSPIAGTVQQLGVSTVGQVVAAGQSLMTVVPADGTIEIEAMVMNQDIGFVEPGQEAVIKVEAFPFTRYGTITGRIVRVSRDAVDEREALGMADPMTASRQSGAQAAGAASSRTQNLVFPATVRLEKRTILVDGKDIPLSPGMAVTVEILTGHRRAIDYVLSPLREVTSSSGRER
jgi:hemolysin D